MGNGHSICVTLNRPFCTFCYFNDKSLITNNRKNILHNTRWRLWTDMHLSLGFSYLVFYRCHPHVYLIRARYQVSWHLGHICPTQASAIPHVKPGSLILKPHLDHKTSARVITNPQLPEQVQMCLLHRPSTTLKVRRKDASKHAQRQWMIILTAPLVRCHSVHLINYFSKVPLIYIY